VPWTEREWGERHLFFRELPEKLRSTLPEDLRGFTFKPQGSLAQLYFQDPRIHYEAWFNWRSGRVGIGLHFEGDETTNDRLFRAFDRRIVEIKARLGDTIDLERWDRGWSRIYESWPCEKVDRPFREQITTRLSQIIRVLQPMLEELPDSARR
jgi:hypothetical protein